MLLSLPLSMWLHLLPETSAHLPLSMETCPTYFFSNEIPAYVLSHIHSFANLVLNTYIPLKKGIGFSVNRGR